MNIEKATKEYIDDIVHIHQDAFEDFFLTSLGEDFLKFYYSCFISSSDGYIICAVDEGKVLGFSAVAKEAKGFNTKLIRRNLIDFIRWGLKVLFTSPESLIRLLKNLTKRVDGVDDNGDYAELFSIAVCSEYQGKGLGKTLLKYTEEYLRLNGIQRISLTTDFYNNSSVIAFYQSMGYVVFYDFITYPNRRMYRLIKKA